MKKTWKGINELINSRNSDLHINHLTINNKIITNPEHIANAMNDFFVNVGSTTEKTIPRSPQSPLSFLKSRIEPNFTITPTSNQEVMMLLLKLDDNKSAGPSNIPIKLLKVAARIIVPQLVSIFNLSFTTGIFPDFMKLAKVIPIF